MHKMFIHTLTTAIIYYSNIVLNLAFGHNILYYIIYILNKIWILFKFKFENLFKFKLENLFKFKLENLFKMPPRVPRVPGFPS